MENYYKNIPANKSSKIGEADLVPVGKLLQNLEKFRNDPRPKVILVSTGALCPVHFMHVEMFNVIRKYLEEKFNWIVVVGYLSPSHDTYVMGKLGRQGVSHIDSFHRVNMVKAALKESDWLEVSGWEASRTRFVNFPEVMSYIAWYLKHNLVNFQNFRAYYACGADMALKCGLSWGSKAFGTIASFGTVAVGRSGDTEELKREHHEEGFYLLETELPDISSTTMRKRMMNNEPLDDLTFPVVVEYIKNQNIQITKLE